MLEDLLLSLPLQRDALLYGCRRMSLASCRVLRKLSHFREFGDHLDYLCNFWGKNSAMSALLIVFSISMFCTYLSFSQKKLLYTFELGFLKFSKNFKK